MASHTSRRSFIKQSGAVASVAAFGGIAGCLGDDDSVAISSKRFTEQRVLGYLAYELLGENLDVEVEDETGLGGTVPNFEALRENEVDLYWEYTGTAWLTLPPQQEEVIADPEELHQEVQEEFEAEHGIAVLERSPLNNTYVITARPGWYEETGIDTLSELAAYANDGNAADLDPVLGPEFQERDDGWAGLLEYYDFEEDAIETVNDHVQTVDEDIVYQALDQNEGNVGMGFNTDPRILMFDLHVFEDDELFFPTYNAVPMVHGETLEANPEIADLLNDLSPELTNERIRELNAEVAIEERNAQNVAREFLEEEGYI
ncbi:Periplasmic glycine betaine/choline-binding lipoprotein of an ABC-type transport system (osmoprotectant binding protein) [Halalkaliarchaeum sp. AArc-CO]|uniref:glycine betaine ABC transporter substrate-binding protein n=1 Tax=unclassified Halalkaliarchaeum TaxID=2678344 RepID=UPI00217CF17D|nr:MULTISPECIES: glycine betaine ABC transporter substrate-binding protein [unclassified Halalkaliarchaeum]MDR5671978.1 glycine betaine ABC transporter substrate-binding protein [Halalkaliarchaeum sp. AArc-GB]UWG51483.1 Periplasmic glycine betaine/choline-binding lipoprotein of an ABC-type transport system (osmoprotectant binding protein) [Halalkaliarchaeum sp. AArc-CO]